MKMETSLRVINKESLIKTSMLNLGTSSDASTESVKHSPATTQVSASPIIISGKDAGKNNKHNSTKSSVSFEDKLKKEPDIAVTELLGSVTTHNCPGVRTSARVIQKMKQDQIRPTTPPPAERDHKHKDERPMQKTPSQVRANKPIWTNIERNHFFDAVNEFGKDFEAIGNYINTKLKRKSGTDAAFKTKDQVRQHYYTTFHKICKHIRFSDEVKKPAQEMYALINYGEMRRKLQFVTDKHFFKMKNLVYHGQIIVRCKGKNIRIKTPSCKALRRLNQLDDSLEDIRLPSKIEVIVNPANMDAFGRVQTIAQNPRARATVPLHKKLINFIKNFQHKWRSAEMKYVEEEAKLFPAIASSNSSNYEQNHAVDNHHDTRPMSAARFQDPEMCFLPKPGVTIHRPLLSITECLSSVNICLSAYEDRMGVKVSGETLCPDRPSNKRQRSESGSEKRSPDAKKQKNNITTEKIEAAAVSSEAQPCLMAVKEDNNGLDVDLNLLKTENSGISCNGEDLNEELNELLSEVDLKEETKIENVVLQLKEEPVAIEVATTSNTAPTTITPSISLPATNTSTSNGRSKRSNNSSKVRSTLTFKPLISEDVIKRIRKGWTVSNAADITIGDLYVVFGHDSRLELDYFWTNKTTAGTLMARPGNSEQTEAAALIFSQKQSGMPYNPSECDDPQLMQTLSKSNISNKLKHLLLIANLSERIRKRQCSCGHTCEKSAKARIERDLATKTFISNKTFLPNTVSTEGSNLFRQPIVPMRRTVFNMDSVRQLTAVSRPKMSRQVLVQRLLLPGGVNHQELLSIKNLQNSIGLNQDKIQTANAPMRAPSTNTFRTKMSHAKPKASTSNTNAMQSSVEHKCSGNLSDPSVSSCNYGQDVERNVFSDISEIPGTHIPTNYSAPNPIESAKCTNDLSCSTSSPSLSDSAFDETSNTSVFNEISPMQLIRDSSSNSRWLEENLNDFSLTSLLGHLDDINSSRDILDPSSNLSVISETSVDYMSKFQEITALMRSQDND